MTDQAPGSGSSADQPAAGPPDPGAGTPSPWSRESSGAGAHPLGADDPAPDAGRADPLPPAPPAYGPPGYGPPPGAAGTPGAGVPQPDPQPWLQPPGAGYGSQPGVSPYADPAPHEPTPPWAQPEPGSGYGVPGQPSSGDVPAGYGVSPYPGGYGGSYPGYGIPEQDHPQATAALITGIVAVVTATFCGVGGLVGIASIVLGAKARREIDSDPARYAGRGKATAGVVMGVVAIVVLLFWLLLFVLVGASSPS